MGSVFMAGSPPRENGNSGGVAVVVGECGLGEGRGNSPEGSLGLNGTMVQPDRRETGLERPVSGRPGKPNVWEGGMCSVCGVKKRRRGAARWVVARQVRERWRVR